MRPPLSDNANTLILLKHVQSNTELYDLENYILEIETQMSVLNIHI